MPTAQRIGIAMLMVHYPKLALACLFTAVGWLLPLAAQEAMDSRQILKWMYSQERGDVEREFTAKTKNLIEAGKQFSGRTITHKERGDLISLVAMVEYQRVIDRMICLEEAVQFGWKHMEGAEKLTACNQRRESATSEMILFTSRYSEIILHSSAGLCAAKTRLLQMEMRYPPYDFMTPLGNKTPYAVDAQLYMECIRSRL